MDIVKDYCFQFYKYITNDTNIYLTISGDQKNGFRDVYIRSPKHNLAYKSLAENITFPHPNHTVLYAENTYGEDITEVLNSYLLSGLSVDFLFKTELFKNIFDDDYPINFLGRDLVERTVDSSKKIYNKLE